MQFSGLIKQHGIAAFTLEDFKRVSSKVSEDPERLILVGGQALEVWAQILSVPQPVQDVGPLTEDADWLGGKSDAKWLCDQLGGIWQVSLQYAEDFGSSPSSAIAFLQRDQRVLMMDFLRAIVGPSSEEVRRIAVKVEFLDGITICVMHPLLCLESRFANLTEIPSKRGGNGPTQAVWAVNIVQAFFRKLIDDQVPPLQVAKACRKVAEIAEFKYGKFCFPRYNLNALDAVPPTALDYVGGKFQSEEWPRRVSRIGKLQAGWHEVYTRPVQHIRRAVL